MRRSRPLRTLLCRLGAAAAVAGLLSWLPLAALAGPAWPRLRGEPAVVAVAPATEVADLAELLPEELIAVAEARGLGARMRDLPTSSLKERLFALPAWKQYQKSPAYVELMAGYGFVELVGGMKAHDLLDAVLGEQLVVALVTGETMPGLVGAVRIGDLDRADHLMQVARTLAAMAKEEPPAWRTESLGGVEALVVREQLYVGQVGRDLLFASTKGRFAELATRAIAGVSMPPPALVAAARASAPQDAIVALALDGPRVTAISGKESWLPVRQDDFVGAALLGDLFALAARAPVVPMSLHGSAESLVFEVALPAPADAPLPTAYRGFGHANAAQPLPTLHPPGMLLTWSMRRDLAALWADHGELCQDKVGAELALAKANLGIFFGGRSLPDEVLPALDESILFVLSRQTFPGVASPPALRYPAGAMIWQARGDHERLGREFANGVQMAIALFNVDSAQKNQAPYELFVDAHRGVQITGGRLPRDDDRAVEPERLNASPCFARVGARLIVASTVELMQALIDELSVGQMATAPSGALTWIEVDGRNVAELALEDRDALIAQATLEQGKSLEQANLEQAFLVDIAREVAKLRLSTRLVDATLRVELALQMVPRVGATRPAREGGP